MQTAMVAMEILPTIKMKMMMRICMKIVAVLTMIAQEVPWAPALVLSSRKLRSVNSATRTILIILMKNTATKDTMMRTCTNSIEVGSTLLTISL